MQLRCNTHVCWHYMGTELLRYFASVRHSTAHKERNFIIALPMQVVSLKDSHESSVLACESLIQLGPFAQWTMDCKLSASPDPCKHQECREAPWSVMLDIGLSDNSVEKHELQMQGGNLVRSSRKTNYCLLTALWARPSTASTFGSCSVLSCFRWLVACGGVSAQSTLCFTQCLYIRQVSRTHHCCNARAHTCDHAMYPAHHTLTCCTICMQPCAYVVRLSCPPPYNLQRPLFFEWQHLLQLGLQTCKDCMLLSEPQMHITLCATCFKHTKWVSLPPKETLMPATTLSGSSLLKNSLPC